MSEVELVKPQLAGSDVLLLIPGKYDSNEKLPDIFDNNVKGQIYIKAIEESMAEELRKDVTEKNIYLGKGMKLPRRYEVLSDYEESQNTEKERTVKVKQFSRCCLGNVTLKLIPDPTMERSEQKDVFEDAFIMLARHAATNYCIAEIFIPECSDTVHDLEAYRHGRMFIRPKAKLKEYENIPCDEDGYFTEENFLKAWHIKCYGAKKSAVFCFDECDDQEYINALANEECPKDGDGQVAGTLKEKLKTSDRAQYKGVHTFASRATLLEIIENADEEGLSADEKLEEHIYYQATEIFFIEMLVLHDASIEYIISELNMILDKVDQHQMNGKEAKQAFEKTRRQLTTVFQFAGTDHYIWPTVQEGVKLLAQDFGMDEIEKRCASAENVLEDMIESLVREEAKENDATKDWFLGIIAFVSGITALGTLIDSVAGEVNYPLIYAVICAAILLRWAVQKYKAYSKKKKYSEEL